MMAPPRMRSRPASGRMPSVDAERGEDEGEFADLREADGDDQRGADRAAEQHDDEVGEHRLADDDDRDRREQRQRIAPEDRRIEQHADGDEEQHRERVAQRQRFLGGAMAELALARGSCRQRTRRARG